MKGFELMRLLIPKDEVKDVAAFTGLTRSLLYMERRDKNGSGSRSTIERLDLFCEYSLKKAPLAVRIVGERYIAMYDRHVATVVDVDSHPATKADLLGQLGIVARECGQAVAALAGQSSLRECTVEVAQAKAALEKALALVTVLEEQQ